MVRWPGCAGGTSTTTGASVLRPGVRLLFPACAIAALLPLFLLPTDFWDGEIVDFAFRTDDFSGLRVWLFESRWNLQYYVYEGVRAVAGVSGLSHRLLLHVLAAAAVVGAALEVRRLAEGTLRLPPRAAFAASLFALLFPAWHVLATSAVATHALCVWWALAGYRLLRSGGGRAWLGAPLALLSLQLNSNFAFLVGLAAADFLARRWLVGVRERIAWPLAFGAVLLALFLVLKLGFPAYGDYAGYNRVVLSRATLADAGRSLAIGLPLFAVQGALLAASLRLAPPEARALRARLALLVLLFLAAAVPYVVVGKPALPGDLGGWTHRNALLLVVASSLTLASAVDLAARARPRVGIALAGSFALASLLLLYAGHHRKVLQAAYRDAFVSALREAGAPPPGAVALRIDAPPPMELRNYVASSLYHEAFGRAAWLVLPARAPLVHPVAASRRERAYRVKAVHPDMTPDCVSRVRIATRRDDAWRWRSWARLLGLDGPPAFRLEARLVDSRCDS